MAEIFGKLGISGSYLISQLVNFTLLAVLLYLVGYKPLLNLLHQRQQRIARSLADADAARENATKAQQEYDRRVTEAQRKAQEIIALAAQLGEQRRVEIETEAMKHAEEIRQRAHDEAVAERDRILAEVHGEIAGLSVMATERVLGQTVAVDPVIQRKLIDQFLAEMGAEEGKGVAGGGSTPVRGVA